MSDEPECNDVRVSRMFADKSCKRYFVCHNGRIDAFNCPMGTLFNEQVMTCDFEDSFRCSTTRSINPTPREQPDHHDPNPNNEPRNENPDFKPPHESSDSEPRHEHPNLEPRHEQPNFEPRHERPETETTDERSDTEPRHEQPDFESRYVPPTYNPRPQQPNFVPRHVPSPSIPRPQHPWYQPRPQPPQPRYDPRSEQPTFEEPNDQDDWTFAWHRVNPNINNNDQLGISNSRNGDFIHLKETLAKPEKPSESEPNPWLFPGKDFGIQI